MSYVYDAWMRRRCADLYIICSSREAQPHLKLESTLKQTLKIYKSRCRLAKEEENARTQEEET